MAYFNNNHSTGNFSQDKFSELFFQLPTRFGRQRGIFSKLVSHFKAWRAERVAAHELFGLSDRELADIGLTRQDIPTVVRIRR